jgi:hypothetical protein
MQNPEIPESDPFELRKKGRELECLLKLKESEFQTYEAEAKTQIGKLQAEFQALKSATKAKNAELKAFKAESKVESEKRKGETANLTQEIEAVGARFQALMDAKNKGLSKRITPYMPPGTSTN